MGFGLSNTTNFIQACSFGAGAYVSVDSGACFRSLSANFCVEKSVICFELATLQLLACLLKWNLVRKPVNNNVPR